MDLRKTSLKLENQYFAIYDSHDVILCMYCGIYTSLNTVFLYILGIIIVHDCELNMHFFIVTTIRVPETVFRHNITQFHQSALTITSCMYNI